MRIVDMKTGREASLNESPSEKEGKCAPRTTSASGEKASMKVPPKRKGNSTVRFLKRTCMPPQ